MARGSQVEGPEGVQVPRARQARQGNEKPAQLRVGCGQFLPGIPDRLRRGGDALLEISVFGEFSCLGGWGVGVGYYFPLGV